MWAGGTKICGGGSGDVKSWKEELNIMGLKRQVRQQQTMFRF